MELFGFTIKKTEDETALAKREPSFVPKESDDGSIEVAPGGVYGTYLDLEGKSSTEGQMITKYRQMSLNADCDSAIQDIVNEAIIIDGDSGPVSISLNKIENISENVKKRITEEFDIILELLNFNNKAYDTFRRWYVDGRLYYHKVIDVKDPNSGLKDIRGIDPRRIKKIREPIKKKEPRTGATIYNGINEYFIYNEKGLGSPTGTGQTQGVKIAKDSICYVHSGVMDARRTIVYSHLHKAIKPLNQLTMLEDASVIYRLSRAPERRIFYIDVGNLPKIKAEQYVRDMMVKHKNKIVYDSDTGVVRDDRRFMTMLEDFWLPRREGSRGTEISTLPGGANLGEMEDVEYFQKKLYQSLNVPLSRLDSENAFNMGRPSEISRDELKFSKFIHRLRDKFTDLFDDLLKTQLILKGVLTEEEWDAIYQKIYYDFQEDNHFSELKNAEIMQGRVQLLGEIDQFVGRYYSKLWVQKNILRLTEDEIDQEKSQMESEGTDDEFEQKQNIQMGLPPDGQSPEQAAPDQGSDQPQQEPESEEDSNERASNDPGVAAPANLRKKPDLKVVKKEATIPNEEKMLLESMTNFFDSMVQDDE